MNHIFNEKFNFLLKNYSVQERISLEKYYYDNGLIVFHYGKEEIWVEFKMNGSKMWVDPATDSSRGGRATLLIFEECRLIKKQILDSVFTKMSHPRQSMFLNLPQYQNDNGTPKQRWIEDAQEIYITSSRYKSEWWWRSFKNVVQECFTNKINQSYLVR